MFFQKRAKKIQELQGRVELWMEIAKTLKDKLEGLKDERRVLRELLDKKTEVIGALVRKIDELQNGGDSNDTAKN